MERVMIHIPEKKSKLVKSLLKELGVVIETDVFQLSRKLNSMMGDEEKPSMDEIVEEINAIRANAR